MARRDSQYRRGRETAAELQRIMNGIVDEGTERVSAQCDSTINAGELIRAVSIEQIGRLLTSVEYVKLLVDTVTRRIYRSMRFRERAPERRIGLLADPLIDSIPIDEHPDREKPLSYLGIRNRKLVAAMEQRYFKNVGDVARARSQNFLSVPGMGPKRLMMVRRRLQKIGLDTRDAVEFVAILKLTMEGQENE